MEPPTTEPLPVPIRSPSPPNTKSALLVARIVSCEAMRVAPNAKALIVAVPPLPDRSIRSPLPTTAPGLKLNPPAPPWIVLPATAPALPLSVGDAGGADLDQHAAGRTLDIGRAAAGGDRVAVGADHTR